MTTEDKEAEIIKIIYAPPYSHAERILHRLSRLRNQMTHEEAIDTIHSELTSE